MQRNKEMRSIGILTRTWYSAAWVSIKMPKLKAITDDC